MGRTTLLRVALFGLALAACGGSEFTSEDSDAGATTGSGGGSSGVSAVSTSITGTTMSSGTSATAVGAGGSASVTGATSTTTSTGTAGSGGSMGGVGGSTSDAAVDAETRDQSVGPDVGPDRLADAPRDVSQDVSRICTGPSDCPPSTSRCRSPSCTVGLCGTTAMPPGPIAAQTVGDCKRIDCTLTGDESIVADDTDSDDRNECTKDSCSSGTPSHLPMTGSHCKNGSNLCDSAGNCVECLAATDCPASVAECLQPQCTNGKCAVTPKPAATFCRGFADQCDGAGNCVDCVNSGACDECCVCSPDHKCIAAFQGE